MKSRMIIACAAIGFSLLPFMTAKPFAVPAFSPWSTPVNLGPTINSAWVDAGAAISKDGLSLYFNSDRPGGFGNQDIWVSQRAKKNASWGTPWNLGTVVNTAALEAVPSLSLDEHWLFFNSTRAGGFGQADLWASYRVNVHDDFAWGPPINLGPNVNSTALDAGADLFANDEVGSPLLFFVSARPGGPGNLDIYVSPLTKHGFGPAALVPELNSVANDRRPSVRFDGLEVFFDSDRIGSAGADLWTSSRDNVSQPWSTPINLGATVNSASDDIQPFIAADPETLIFASNRSGGSGDFDLYVTTRTKGYTH
jgi:hypothetical protein